MTANTTLIHAIAHALIGEYGEEATGWLEDGGRANVERIVAEWRTAIEEGRWIERIEDVLVLRALRHETHWVEVLGGPDAEALILELADEGWHERGVETATRIGEIFAHELLRGDSGEPFDSIEFAWREHGDAIRGEDDEQRWNAAKPLSSAETRVAVCLAEARYVERRVPFIDLPGSVRRAKAAVDAGDESGWTPVAEGPVLRYVRALREDGAERAIRPDLRLRTLYTVELVCAPDRSLVLVDEGLRGRLHDVASKAVESGRVPYTAGYEFSPATLLRVGALKSKHTRSLDAYGLPSLKSRTTASYVQHEIPSVTHRSASRRRNADPRYLVPTDQASGVSQTVAPTIFRAPSIQTSDTLRPMFHRSHPLSRQHHVQQRPSRTGNGSQLPSPSTGNRLSFRGRSTNRPRERLRDV